MIRPFDPNTEGAASPEEEPTMPKVQPIQSFDDLPLEHQKDLEQYTEAVGEMITARMKQKACEEAGGVELYLACLVEQLAYLHMTQQSQNMYLLKVGEHLADIKKGI